MGKQEDYAKNLKCSLGTAVYLPLPLRPHSGRVGDVAFFHSDGRYEWIRNAFDTEV